MRGGWHRQGKPASRHGGLRANWGTGRGGARRSADKFAGEEPAAVPHAKAAEGEAVADARRQIEDFDRASDIQDGRRRIAAVKTEVPGPGKLGIEAASVRSGLAKMRRGKVSRVLTNAATYVDPPLSGRTTAASMEGENTCASPRRRGQFLLQQKAAAMRKTHVITNRTKNERQTEP